MKPMDMTADAEAVPPIDMIIARLARIVDLSASDETVIRQLPWTERVVTVGKAAGHQADVGITRPGFVVAGGVIRSRHRVDGAKQSVGLALPGDPLGLETLFGRAPIDDTAALPRTVLLETGAADLRRAFDQSPRLAMAFAGLLMIDLSVAEQWVFCLSKMDAMQRIGHFLAEMSVRMSAWHGSPPATQLALTQEQIAEMVGLTPVHVNRTLHVLATAGHVALSRGLIQLINVEALRQIGQFDGAYLMRTA